MAGGCSYSPRDQLLFTGKGRHCVPVSFHSRSTVAADKTNWLTRIASGNDGQWADSNSPFFSAATPTSPVPLCRVHFHPNRCWKDRQFACALFRRYSLPFALISAPFTLLGFLERVAKWECPRDTGWCGKKPGKKERGTRCFVAQLPTTKGTRRQGEPENECQPRVPLRPSSGDSIHLPSTFVPSLFPLSPFLCFISQASALRSVSLRVEVCFEPVELQSIESRAFWASNNTADYSWKSLFGVFGG